MLDVYKKMIATVCYRHLFAKNNFSEKKQLL